MSEPPVATEIETLWRDPSARSRNRNFDRFSDPGGAHARRVVLYLLMLRAELVQLPAGAVRASRGSWPRGTVRLSYENVALGLRRIAFLTEQEAALLTDAPDVREKLAWE